jgi:hypothetical protein
MPPLVPATVNAGVVVAVATEIILPVKLTLVTVPPGLLDAMLMPPAEFVMVMLDPAVSVARVNPVPLPMSKAPFAGVVDNPVPPFATFKMPASVTAPVEGVFGVNPVEPALKVEPVSENKFHEPLEYP